MRHLLTIVLSATLALLGPAGALADTDDGLLSADDDLSAALGITALSWPTSFVDAITGPLDDSSEPGRYDDPFFLNWAEFLPAYPDGDVTASTEQDCPPGSVHCVDNVIREMTRRYNRLGCDRDAVFALTYLLTTEEYRRAVEDPDFFEDNAFVNHEDAVFAEFYFDAFDAWHKGRVEDTPPAWRIAFHAAEEREVTGTGDILLGMNAHIRRDLPFVLEAIGLVAPDGTSRKADHDKVNEILNAVNPTIFPAVARYHDPTVDDGDVPFTSIDSSANIQIVVEWREEAWRKAEMLANAPTEEDRDAIARWIENEAAASAMVIRDVYASDSTTRDAYCAANWEPH